jgi:hypothetical protein
MRKNAFSSGFQSFAVPDSASEANDSRAFPERIGYAGSSGPVAGCRINDIQLQKNRESFNINLSG